MTWSYSGDPTSSQKDLVRFTIGDKNQNDQLLSDEEIQYLLNTFKSPIKAAIEACSAIIANFSREVDYSLGPENVKASQYITNFKTLRNELQSRAQGDSAAPSWTGPDENTPFLFDIGMHDFGGDV